MPLFSLKASWFVIGTITVVLVGATFFTQRPQDADETTTVHGDPDSLDNAGTTTTQGDAGKQSAATPAHTTSLPFTPLNTVEERQRYYDSLFNESPQDLFQQLLNVDGLRREYVIRALAAQLQKGGHEDIYTEIGELLGQLSLPTAHKSTLIALLTDTATPTAIRVLLNAADDDTLRPSIAEAIKSIGDNHWGAGFHPELSPPMETAWKDAVNDSLLSQSLAVGIAKVGAPSGITLLLTEMDGHTYTQITQGQDMRAAVVLGAMRDIDNPSAVPVLTQWFHSHQLADAAFMASGRGLSAIATPEATAVLLAWAKQAPDEAAPLARQWLGQVRDKGLYNADLMRTAISDGSAFRSDKVRTEIVSLLHLLDSSEE